MKQTATQNDQARPIFGHSTDFSMKFSMIGLGQEDEIEEITLRPEVWWHDVVSHEVDDCWKWSHSAIVLIFWSRPAEGAVALWTSCYLKVVIVIGQILQSLLWIIQVNAKNI